MILAGPLSIRFILHDFNIYFWTHPYSHCFFFALSATSLRIRDVFLYLITHCHSEFYMDMNGANPFICFYDIIAVVLPKCVALSKAIYNWKLVHHHPPHLDFCQHYRHILLGYNTRIKNFWYHFSYIFCFSFCLLFYLDGIFAVEKYKLLLPWLVKNNIHQANIYFCDEFLRALYIQIKR